VLREKDGVFELAKKFVIDFKLDIDILSYVEESKLVYVGSWGCSRMVKYEIDLTKLAALCGTSIKDHIQQPEVSMFDQGESTVDALAKISQIMTVGMQYLPEHDTLCQNDQMIVRFPFVT